MRLNSFALHDFAEVVNATNQTGQWDVELTWYSPTVCLYFLEYGFGPTWSCLILNTVANWKKYLEPSVDWTVINCADNFRIAEKVFDCFHDVMTMFEFVKHMVPSSNELYVHWYGFQINYEVKQYTMCDGTTIAVLLTTRSTFHYLNCFGPVTFARKTNAKILRNLGLN